MNTNNKKVNLTEKDKKTITKNTNLCTDFHSGDCNKNDKELKQVK